MNRLMRLLQIYRASLIELVKPEAPASEVVRFGEEVRVHSHREHIDAYLLVADTDRPLVPMVWVYEPGAAMGEPAVLLTDHFSHVIAGDVVISLDGTDHRLGPGDTIYVRAGRPFQIRNAGDHVARILGCGIQTTAGFYG